MAARPSAVPRRDFLRTLGQAAGITVPDVADVPTGTAPPTAPPASPPPSSPPVTPPPSATSPPPTENTPSPDATASADPEAEAVAPEAEETAPERTAEAVPTPIQVSATDRNLLSRFSYGISQKLLADVEPVGASAWFEDQLDPGSIPDDFADGLKSWWPCLSWTPQKMWDENVGGGMPAFNQQGDFLRWTLLRRIHSKRQVHEVMAEFWSNLLYIPAPLTKAFPHRISYDEVIREHALGTYADMLEAAILHPAMGCFLDNAKSNKRAVNENLGRELLELHTVGVHGGYTEPEVADSARILTGWHVDAGTTWEAYYVETDHATGPVRVLDFESVNSNADGRQMSRDYLQYLARHEKTAARVARRLAVRFVSDYPSEALVTYLAGVFMDSGTDIKTTLRALVAHSEFKGARTTKVRTPTEDTANTFRILDVGFPPPNGDPNSAAQAILFVTTAMGQQPFDWPRPDGFPDNAQAWSSASRALGSWRVHKNAVIGIPKGAIYHPLSYWVPTLPMRFDAMVNHLSLRLTAQPATAQMVRAATRAVEVEPDEFVLATSGLVTNRMPDLLVALLDSPQHMMR